MRQDPMDLRRFTALLTLVTGIRATKKDRLAHRRPDAHGCQWPQSHRPAKGKRRAAPLVGGARVCPQPASGHPWRAAALCSHNFTQGRAADSTSSGDHAATGVPSSPACPTLTTASMPNCHGARRLLAGCRVHLRDAMSHAGKNGRRVISAFIAHRLCSRRAKATQALRPLLRARGIISRTIIRHRLARLRSSATSAAL
jgi:hypothetical protein